jgi:phosphatidylglycerol:prolipoprotein diacylglycerol transferase
MGFLAIPYPDIKPEAFWIGPLAVKWYGLAYVAGLLLGRFYVKALLQTDRLWPSGKRPFASETVDDLLLFMTVGVLLGGRLGYVLFYQPRFFLANPFEIVAVWRGGMSFHGALLGSIASIVLFARRVHIVSKLARRLSKWRRYLGFYENRPVLRTLDLWARRTLSAIAVKQRKRGIADANVWSVLDVCAAAAPMGLLFGRLANFVNVELWGRISDVPWAMVFPHPDAGPLPRHPSQLYEALTEGLVLFAVLWWLTHRRQALRTPGVIGGAFLVGYGLARSFCEFFREPDAGHILTVGPFTAGIFYSLPMVLVGFLAIRAAGKRNSAPANVQS